MIVSIFFLLSFFLLCVVLDFYITYVGSGGDLMMEGNVIARFIWQIMGPFRFIEILIWPAVVFCVTNIVGTRSRFLAILWLNILAFNHLLGFVTWLPYGTHNFLNIINSWIAVYPIVFISFFISLPLTFIELNVVRHLLKVSDKKANKKSLLKSLSQRE
ncbi:MAG: hypothetical protein WCG60_00530 [bacterium]